MLSRFKLEEGWSTLFLVWVLVTLAAAAILEAELISGLEVLPFVSTISMFAGLALAKSRFSSRTAHIIGLIYGFALVTYLMGTMLPGDMTWQERVFDLFERQFVWLTKALSQGSSRDGLIFVIHTSAIFWLLGYTASWYTFRESRIWRVVIPSGLVLLSVIYYYYGPKSLAIYLAGYILVALLYIARTHLVAKEELWRSAVVRYEQGIRFSFLRASFLAAVLALGISWSLPTLTANAAVSEAVDRTGFSGTWRGFQDNWTRLFSSLRTYGGTTNDPYRDSLSLGGPRTVGNTLVMDIYVAERLPYIYWQAVAFDNYEDGLWTLADSDQVLHFPDEGRIETPFAAARQVVVQTVINYLPSAGTIYGAPEIINSDRQIFVTRRMDDSGNNLISHVQSRFILKQGESYEVTSRVSNADAASLRQAITAYPDWVTESYLQVPDSITPETLDLAAELTAEYDNAFDKSIAIRDYLRRTISYNDQIPAPPDGAEPIHYVLFERQEAYCNYYASAMAMMLRSQGVPARVVAGYAQGEFDADTNSYRVRASNAHTWVEVYFPNYGWIQFEPTASIPIVDRPETASGNPGDGFESGSDLEQKEDLFEEDLAAEENQDRLEDILNEENAPAAPILSRARIFQAAGALAVLAVGAFLAFVASQFNRRVEMDTTLSYGRLASWGRWLGIFIRPVHTPYERATLLSTALPEGKEPIRNLTQEFVRQRFSRDRSVAEGFEPLKEWQILRPMLIKRTVAVQINRLRENLRRRQESRKD